MAREADHLFDEAMEGLPANPELAFAIFIGTVEDILRDNDDDDGPPKQWMELRRSAVDHIVALMEALNLQFDVATPDLLTYDLPKFRHEINCFMNVMHHHAVKYKVANRVLGQGDITIAISFSPDHREELHRFSTA